MCFSDCWFQFRGAGKKNLAGILVLMMNL